MIYLKYYINNNGLMDFLILMDFLNSCELEESILRSKSEKIEKLSK